METKKYKLLVVDDEKDICKFVKRLFSKKGFLVYTAFSGNQAIKIASKIKPDIALLDIYLKRGLDGLQTLKRLRKISPQCHCLMVTWDKAEEKRKGAKKLGAVSYLTKPLTVTQLYQVVNRFIKNKRKGDE